MMRWCITNQDSKHDLLILSIAAPLNSPCVANVHLLDAALLDSEPALHSVSGVWIMSFPR